MVAGSGDGARLAGRRSECEALDQLVTDVLTGTSRVLVLRGDAGVGKSVLLRHLSERLTGWRVMRAVGVEAEIELAYSGLHQLCAPLLHQLGKLPGPQCDALATVFGLDSGPAPDRFVVGLATLTLIAEAAEDRPLACLVDDAQWLDQASAQILAFVARRLLAERVALVCAVRTGAENDVLVGQPALPIGGLSEDDARTLLSTSLHGPLDTAVRDQIVAECQGNPLALLELPRAWGPAVLAGGFGLPHGRPVAGKIEDSYLRRLLLLPPGTQLLVLAAAADPQGDPVLLQRAARILDLDMAAAAPAVDAGLLRIRTRVEFAHPLVRSAVYRRAGPDARHRVHRALAEATDPQADPDRRAWHRSRGTTGPDDEVAAELERSAGRAEARGGLAAAAAFLTRATELTGDPTARAHRAMAAASANVQAGAFETARALLAVAGEGPVDDLQRARIDLLGAQLAFATSRGTGATSLLLAAARRLEHLDGDLARDTCLDALTAALFAARMADDVGPHDLARAARAARRPSAGEPAVADVLLDALAALLTEDDDAAFPVTRTALRRLAADPQPAQQRTRWLWLGCAMACDLWDDESWYTLSDRFCRTVRHTGALSELPHAVNTRATILLFCGELPAAASLIDEGLSVQEARGISTAPYASLALAAWQGQADKARPLIDRAIRESTTRGEGWGVSFSEYTRALLCNSLGQHDEALIAAGRALAHSQSRAGVNLGLPELIEAASRTGRPELAADALDQVSRKARASGTGWALGIEARSRALLSGGDAAEEWFRAAIKQLSRTRVRGELARSRLLYGEWLRQTGRRADARSELTIAYELFSEMGMRGFAERARHELKATGVAVPQPTVATRADLTAQEAQIARLARDGLSNPEIGAELFISSRTVEWHMRKVFTKLGITSRRQLRRALSDHDRPVTSA